jgi:hypothetical protein
MARLPFKSLFCEKFGCSPADYEERAFRMCLYWHAWLLAPVVRVLKPDFFREDFKLIGYLGEAVGVREATADLMEYSLFNRGRGRFLHTGLKIRVSGRKASQIVFQLFQEAGDDEVDAATPPAVRQPNQSP